MTIGSGIAIASMWISAAAVTYVYRASMRSSWAAVYLVLAILGTAIIALGIKP